MIYVRFGSDNKSEEMRTTPPKDGDSGYVAVSDDSLFGKRLVKTKTKIREFTKAEYEAESKAAELAVKSIVIDNMAKKALRDSEGYALPDFYESLSDEKKAEVKAYRDALRNISSQEKYPEYVEFPEKPNI